MNFYFYEGHSSHTIRNDIYYQRESIKLNINNIFKDSTFKVPNGVNILSFSSTNQYTYMNLTEIMTYLIFSERFKEEINNIDLGSSGLTNTKKFNQINILYLKYNLYQNFFFNMQQVVITNNNLRKYEILRQFNFFKFEKIVSDDYKPQFLENFKMLYDNYLKKNLIEDFLVPSDNSDNRLTIINTRISDIYESYINLKYILFFVNNKKFNFESRNDFVVKHILFKEYYKYLSIDINNLLSGGIRVFNDIIKLFPNISVLINDEVDHLFKLGYIELNFYPSNSICRELTISNSPLEQKKKFLIFEKESISLSIFSQEELNFIFNNLVTKVKSNNKVYLNYEMILNYVLDDRTISQLTLGINDLPANSEFIFEIIKNNDNSYKFNKIPSYTEGNIFFDKLKDLGFSPISSQDYNSLDIEGDYGDAIFINYTHQFINGILPFNEYINMKDDNEEYNIPKVKGFELNEFSSISNFTNYHNLLPLSKREDGSFYSYYLSDYLNRIKALDPNKDVFFIVTGCGSFSYELEDRIYTDNLKREEYIKRINKLGKLDPYNIYYSLKKMNETEKEILQLTEKKNSYSESTELEKAKIIGIERNIKILNDKINLLQKNFYKRKYKITYNQN